MIDPERHATPLAAAGSVALVVAVACGSWVGVPLALVGVGLLAAACVSRADGFLLAGPYLRHDLTRTTRRYRVHLWRTLALCVAVGPTLALAFFAFGPVGPGARVTRTTMIFAAEAGFAFVAWILFLIYSATTANFLAASVVEDREAKRLDFTLATDLRSREVVVGKAIARAVGATGYVLAAVPLVLVLPALFGVDPALIVVCLGFAVPSLVSVAGLAVYGSVVSKTKKASGMMPGRVLGMYAVVGLVLAQLNSFAVWFWPGTNVAPVSFAVGDAIDLFNVGNPFALGRRFAFTWTGGVNLTPLVGALPHYAAFHVGLGLLFLLRAVRRLRPASADMAGEPPPPELVAAASKRPPVFDRPVVWKERYCVPAQARTRQAKIAAVLAVVLFAVVPAGAFLFAAGAAVLGVPQAEIVHVARFAPPIIALIGVVTGMNLAAGTVARERERDTLPSLLLTPLSAREILWQKFLGVLGQGRVLVFWQLIVGVPAVLCGGVRWWAFLVVLAGQGLFTVLGVCVGLAASVRPPTVEKASREVAVWFGVWFFGSSTAAGFLAAALLGAKTSQGLVLAALAGFYPPVGLILLGQAEHMEPGTWPYWVIGYALGWAGYAVAARRVWRLAVERFEMATGEAGEETVTGSSVPVATGPHPFA